MFDHRITEAKLSPSTHGARPSGMLRGACIVGLLVCSAVACRNEPTQTSEPLQPGAAGGANLDQNDTTRGMGTTGSGTRTANDGTHGGTQGTQGTPMSGSGSGNPGASANDIQRTGGNDSERTGSGGTSGHSGGGHGGSAGHGGRGGSAGSGGR